jgi:hypothetical protein
MGDTTNYPKKKYRIKKCSSAVFEKQSTTKEGKPVTKMSVSLQKGSKDQASGEWQNQVIWLYPDEIPALITVAQQAYEFCALNKQSEE